MERMVPINQPEAQSAARGLRQFVSFAPCLQRTPVFNLGEVRQRGRGACNRALPALDLRFRRWNNMTSPRGEPATANCERRRRERKVCIDLQEGRALGSRDRDEKN